MQSRGLARGHAFFFSSLPHALSPVRNTSVEAGSSSFAGAEHPRQGLEGDDEGRPKNVSNNSKKSPQRAESRRGVFPRDQLSTISLLLLVDPEVTDIERRAMETSL